MKKFMQIGKRILAIALVALSVFAVALPAMADSNLIAGDTGIVTVSDTNGYVWLRTGAGSSYAHDNRRLYANCELLINGKSGEWYNVKVTKSVPGANGTASAAVNQTGYVHQDYVTKKNSGGSNTYAPGWGVGNRLTGAVGISIYSGLNSGYIVATPTMVVFQAISSNNTWVKAKTNSSNPVEGYSMLKWMDTDGYYAGIAALGGTNFQRGATGEAVKNLQMILYTLGYYGGAIDGTFGSGTESAVMYFQQDNSLTKDGVVGPATRTALGAAWIAWAIKH